MLLPFRNGHGARLTREAYLPVYRVVIHDEQRERFNWLRT